MKPLWIIVCVAVGLAVYIGLLTAGAGVMFGDDPERALWRAHMACSGHDEWVFDETSGAHVVRYPPGFEACEEIERQYDAAWEAKAEERRKGALGDIREYLADR